MCNPDRLGAIAVLIHLESQNAPEGEIRKALASAAKAVAAAVRMTEDVAAGACPGCGRTGSGTTDGCKNPHGCGRANVAADFAALLGKPALVKPVTSLAEAQRRKPDPRRSGGQG